MPWPVCILDGFRAGPARNPADQALGRARSTGLSFISHGPRADFGFVTEHGN